MPNRIFVFLTIIALIENTFSQQVSSTWISGSNSIFQNGNYGTQGIESSSNFPGARYGAVSWTDSNDNLWLFGGNGYAATGAIGAYLNDLWKFNGVNWTWVSGSNLIDQIGNYGTQGIASSSNIPGARRDAVSWTDLNNLWLFGGYGYDSTTVGWLNDLWKFDGMNWTWVSGSDSRNQFGNYGTQGIASSSNVPGARQGAVSWTDSNNTLWLFGGDGYDAAGSRGYLNDLWKFNGVNWTWVSGSNSRNQSGNYGTKGITSSSNVPGGRRDAATWKDSNDNLWLFGGLGYPAATGNAAIGSLNDLWKYDGMNWTWISGTNLPIQYGRYGTQGIASSSNVPGGRRDAVTWKDSNNTLWLFGGNGYAAAGSRGYLSDLWKFDGMNWTWISGSNITNQLGNYGTQGIASLSNIPGARDTAVSWTDSNDNFWLFGGNGYSTSVEGYLNDLWKYEFFYPITSGPLTSISVTSGSLTSNSLTSGPLTSMSVTSGSLTSNSLASGSLTSNSLTSGLLTSMSVTSGSLTSNSLTTSTTFTASTTSTTSSTSTTEGNAESETSTIRITSIILIIIGILVLIV